MDEIKNQFQAQDALLKSKIDAAKQNAQNPEKLGQTAEDFEALFVNYMLQNMRKTVMKSGLLDEGTGGEIMLSMFDQKISQQVAEHSKIGIAELLLQQLTQQDGAEVLPNLSLKGLPLRRSQLPSKSVSGYQAARFNDNTRPFDRLIQSASHRTGVDQDLIRAVIMAESNGNPQAVSHKNARGLMQLIDSTAAEMGVKNSLDPEQNIRGGSKYLASMLERFDGDTPRALAAYNAGPSAVEKYDGIPPYRETRQYVNKVLAFYRQYKDDSLNEIK